MQEFAETLLCLVAVVGCTLLLFMFTGLLTVPVLYIVLGLDEDISVRIAVVIADGLWVGAFIHSRNQRGRW